VTRGIRVAALQVPALRSLTLAYLLNTFGMVGEMVLLGWVVLELTNSPFMVGVAFGARQIPLLLVGVPAGVIADRTDRYRLLRGTNLAMAGVDAALGLLFLLGVADVTQILTLTFVSGCLRGLHQTARQSYVHDVAGAGALVDALAAQEIASRTGGLAGSLATGVLIARLGPGVAFLAAGASYLLSALALGPARTGAPRAASSADSLRESLMGLATAVRAGRILGPLLCLTAASEVLGFSHQTVLPSLARDVYAVGSEGLGAMNAARLVGGILGIAAVWTLGPAIRRGPLFLGALAVFGTSLVMLALARSFSSVLLILVVANAAGGLADLLSQTLIQLSVPATLRGRAGGVWVLAIGTAPAGQLQIGALASLAGVSAALGTSGVALLLVTAAGALLVPRIRRL
jgi:hypothetical protein